MRATALFSERDLDRHLAKHISPEAERAADLCKCDLLTAMVGEFPELQGIMGTYYALADGEPRGGLHLGAGEEHTYARAQSVLVWFTDLPAGADGQMLEVAEVELA